MYIHTIFTSFSRCFIFHIHSINQNDYEEIEVRLLIKNNDYILNTMIRWWDKLSGESLRTLEIHGWVKFYFLVCPLQATIHFNMYTHLQSFDTIQWKPICQGPKIDLNCLLLHCFIRNILENENSLGLERKKVIKTE